MLESQRAFVGLTTEWRGEDFMSAVHGKDPQMWEIGVLPRKLKFYELAVQDFSAHFKKAFSRSKIGAAACASL